MNVDQTARPECAPDIRRLTWPLVKGTPDDVRRDVKEHMAALKPGGRYIAGSSHSIVNYIPHENFVAMINAFHEYGQY